MSSEVLVPASEAQALVALDEARRQIALAKASGDIDALKEWRDRAAAVQHYARQRAGAKEIANDAAFVPSGTCYLLPFQTLRRAWQTEGRAWIDKAEQERDGFRVVLAQNNGYTTESVAVPIPVLLDAIRDSMVIRFDPGLPMTQPTIEGWYA